MANVLDMFKTDGYSLASLTGKINRIPLKPTKIQKMGLFSSEGVMGTTVYLDERDGVLQLIPKSARCTPGLVNKKEDQRVRKFETIHLQLDDAVWVYEVAGKRAFGSPDQAEGVASVVLRKITRMRDAHEATLEWHRLGAIKGVVYDADGTTLIHDLYDEFGVYRPADIDFDVDTAATEQAPLAMAAKRVIEGALGFAAYDHIHAFCGAGYMNSLVVNTSVRDAYDAWQEGAFARNDMRQGFPFGGIYWEEYVGKVGDNAFIADNECRIFPVGVDGLFLTYFAPGDFNEEIGAVGKPFYAKQWEMEDSRGINITTESNPLCICTRPSALIRGYY